MGVLLCLAAAAAAVGWTRPVQEALLEVFHYLQVLVALELAGLRLLRVLPVFSRVAVAEVYRLRTGQVLVDQELRAKFASLFSS
jgi:hypothetical protein